MIEVKVSAFKPADIGQLGTYIPSVNHILKAENDTTTISNKFISKDLSSK